MLIQSFPARAMGTHDEEGPSLPIADHDPLTDSVYQLDRCERYHPFSSDITCRQNAGLQVGCAPDLYQK